MTAFTGKRARAINIKRRDGLVFGFTSHDFNRTINGVLYRAGGFNSSRIITTAGPSVGNLEMKVFHDETTFTRKDLFNGIWRQAEYLIFSYNWENPADGSLENMLAGVFGEVKVGDNELTIELRDLNQYFQQPIGKVSQKLCRARLGDAQCKKLLGPITFAFTITSVIDNQNFVVSAFDGVHAVDAFGNGVLSFDSGNNDGAQVIVKEYLANGTFTIETPMWGNILPGDTGSVIYGCRHRLEEDCFTKHDNVLNYDGEPHRKGLNDLTKRATASV